jgi:hypothetical protein
MERMTNGLAKAFWRHSLFHGGSKHGHRRNPRSSRGCKWDSRLLSGKQILTTSVRHLSAWGGLWLSAVVVVPGANAIAAPYTVVVETRADAPGGQELFGESFPTRNDFVQTGVHTNYGFSLLDIDPAFQLVALTYNGSEYVAVVETRADAPGGQELFVEGFPTLNDFVQTGVHTNYGFSLLDIDPAFQLAGFTYDGSEYVAVVETRADAPGGQELRRDLPHTK